MKKLISFSITLLLTFTIIGLTGCGEDEEPEVSSGSGVVYVFPKNGMSDVPTTTSMQATFKKDVFAPSAANVIFTPGVGGAVSYDSDSYTMTFKPSSPLAGNIEYTMKIDGITDKSGDSVSPVTVNFTTSGPDKTRPEIIFSSPEDDQVDIGHDPDIVLKFSEPMDRPKLRSGISIQPTVEPDIEEWFFEWGIGDEEELTIFPSAGLEPLEVNKEYVLVIPNSSIVDLSGNSMLGSHTVTFKTLKYPVERVANEYFRLSMVEEAWLFRVGRFGNKWAVFYGGQRPKSGPSAANPAGTVTASADGHIVEESVDYWEAEGRAHTISVTKGDGNRLSFTSTADQVDDYYRVMFSSTSRYLTFQFSGVSKEWIHIGNDLTNPSRTPFIMEND